MNSSVVLAAIVGLWLIWVAPYVLRIRRPVLSAEPVATSALVSSATAESTVSQGSIMEMSGHTNDATGTQRGGAASTGPSPQGKVTIRRGRTSLALIGAVALLAAVVCLPLAALSLVSALIPAAAFVVFLLAVAGLRVLAIRDRRRKVEAAFADAMSPRMTDLPARTQAIAAPAIAAPRRETNLFDAETSGPAADRSPVTDHHGTTTGAPGTANRTANLTATELRRAALAVAASADPESAASAATEPNTESAGTPWEPVEVPKPMYVAAAKAQRQAPAPLELPAAPKAQAKTTLKQGAVAPAVDSPDTSAGDSSTANPTTGRMNLDDVLQRRRA